MDGPVDLDVAHLRHWNAERIIGKHGKVGPLADLDRSDLVVDAELPPANLPIPKSDNYRHFGGGQTEVTLELEPGTHTLQLLLGDHFHVPHDPPVVSEKITITVH